jgi:hypothetical protein
MAAVVKLLQEKLFKLNYYQKWHKRQKYQWALKKMGGRIRSDPLRVLLGLSDPVYSAEYLLC